MKKLAASLFILLSSLAFAPLAFAHVVVTPATVGIGTTQTFDVSVPSEKDNPTVALKLMIPDGLQDVTPTIVPGWTITTSSAEIDWANGSIPSGQRADFTFRAQVPQNPATLKWKAIQTYSDGSVVSWTASPVPGHEEDDSMTPYSQTKVINDLTPSQPPKAQAQGPSTNTAVTFSLIALALSAIALGISLRKK